MNINNPTTFSTPDLTLSTSNSSGTAGALRADDTILVYDTTVPASVTSGSSATGSAATAARRDHVHNSPGAGGDVAGPSSAVDNAIARFNGTGGKTIQAYTSNSPTMSDAGLFIAAGQPTVLAFLSGTVSDVTGDGTAYDIVFNTEIIDTTSSFNTSTGVFTAPVEGRYMITAVVSIDDAASGMTVGYLGIITSSRSYTIRTGDAGVIADANGQMTTSACVIVDMAASNTAKIQYSIYNGSKAVDIIGGIDATCIGIRLMS